MDSMIVSPTDIDAGAERTGDSEAGTAPVGDAPNDQVSGPNSIRTPDIQRIVRLPVTMSVELAERDMPVEAILAITVGTIIEFEVPFDSQLRLQIAGRTIGYGQAVKAGERFGLRLASVGSVHQRIDAMGRA